MKRITVKDIIEHLKTQPQDMEVWWTWDESGEYFPLKEPHGRIDFINEKERGGELRWEEAFEQSEGTPVFVLGHPR